MPDHAVSFRSVWKDKKSFRPQLLSYKSKYLRALYEVSKELQPLENFAMFAEIRNLLTHRFLVLHNKAGDWNVSVDGNEYHWGYREFSDATLQLLGLAKAAIIYLVAFVRDTESENMTNKMGFVSAAVNPREDLGAAKSEV
jgi:hypothetical protein